MSRTILIGIFAALLAAGSTRNASAIESANQTGWARARLACADIGVDPGSSAFSQCVFDLYYSLWSRTNPSADWGNTSSRMRCKASGSTATVASRLGLRPPVASPYRRASPW
jgi:DNA-binding transcriptional regulator YdaS (Cro superfamily)